VPNEVNFGVCFRDKGFLVVAMPDPDKLAALQCHGIGAAKYG
jgi:hypothetical protein